MEFIRKEKATTYNQKNVIQNI